ncbi:hypothetical protein BRE01_62610 [Brevibacillus reuszeri]|uniref:Uncharacterized protein n=1 Tax=Brevibacillus reuszeri TaxID=54915 RepID=A0ABQ0TXP6_9BACL|nr:hypothetical protein BRE01_62610 [Brevibacillus reuszeri]
MIVFKTLRIKGIVDTCVDNKIDENCKNVTELIYKLGRWIDEFDESLFLYLN